MGTPTFTKRIVVAAVNTVFLFLGICFPLYVLEFPVFGPMTSSAISVKVILAIFWFSFVYSFIWVQLSLSVIRRLKNIIK